jgi:microcystin-dependent protein
MANITGIFLLDVGITKTPRNNVTATLCAASGFTSPPQKNDAIPTGSVIASVTTGTQYGGDGQYAFYNVPAVAGGYYVALDYAGSIVYDDHTDFGGSSQARVFRVVTTALSYTIQPLDAIILASASGQAITITLPSAAAVPDYLYTVKKIDGSANPVTVNPVGGQTIDGQSSVIFTRPQASLDFLSVGSNWRLF